MKCNIVQYVHVLLINLTVNEKVIMKLKPLCCYSFFVWCKTFALKNGCSVGFCRQLISSNLRSTVYKIALSGGVQLFMHQVMSFSHCMISTLQSKPVMSKCYIISLLAVAALQVSYEIILRGNRVLMCHEGTTILNFVNGLSEQAANRYTVLITQEDVSLSK